MSRKVINILFIVGSCLYIPGIAMIIWAYIDFFQNLTQHSYSGTYNADPFNGLGMFIGFFWAGAIMIGIGSITLLVARIGALMELGKAQDWVWFILMIIFGWIVLLLYLIVGPKSEPAPAGYVGHPYPYPPGQPWTGYYPPQVPGTPPPGQPWMGYYPPQVPGMTSPPGQPYPPQAPGMTSPSGQPWSPQPSVERQDSPDKPREEGSN